MNNLKKFEKIAMHVLYNRPKLTQIDYVEENGCV